MTLKTSKGKKFFIDSKDFEIVSGYSWNIKAGKGKEYVYSNKWINGKSITTRLHRLLLDAKTGQEVDHINGNGLDNRRSNLRICTRQQNCMNRKINKNNTSGFKGVSFDNDTNTWVAQIQVGNKKIWLGAFAKVESAAKKYDSAAIKYHGYFAKTNTKQKLWG